MNFECNPLPLDTWEDIMSELLVDMPTYYSSLDKLTEVYEKGMITLVTGRTSQAKTCFVLNLIIEQLLNNKNSVCLWVEFPFFTSHTAY